MPIPSSIADLSTTAASNSPLGNEPPTEGDNHIRALAAIVKQVYEEVTESDGIDFLQAGTGTVSRTSQSKMRDIVSVKDFGAVGDGVTDDTAALQAALDRIDTVGGELLFPSGVYNYTALTLTTGAANAIRLRGVSSMNRTNFTQGSVLVCTGSSGNAFTLDGAAVAASVIFDGLVFKGNANMDAGLVLYRSAGVVLRNTVLQGWSKAGAHAVWSKKGASAADFTGALTLENCRLSGNANGWYTDSITSNAVSFKGTSFLDNTRGILVGTTAIELQAQQISTDEGCTFEGNVIDIECFGGIQGLNIRGGYFESTNAAHQDARIRIVENAFSGRNKAINIDGALFSRTVGTAGASIVYIESADLIRIKSCFTVNGGAVDRYFVDVATGTNTLIDIDKPAAPAGVTPYPIHASSGDFDAFKSADRHGLETLSKPYSLGKVSAGVANVTGDGTSYTVLFNTQVYDNTNNYDPTTGIFNVPATGVYRITARVALEQVASGGGFAGGFLNLVATGATHTLDYTGSASLLAANEQLTLQGSIDVKATAGDTFRINLQISGGTKTIDIVNTPDTNQFSVAML
jgi:hypothetical protein